MLRTVPSDFLINPFLSSIFIASSPIFNWLDVGILFDTSDLFGIIGKVKPIMKTLLGPHIDDLELKLRPGMVTLTWTSMNIDSYLEHVHNGLRRLE